MEDNGARRNGSVTGAGSHSLLNVANGMSSARGSARSGNEPPAGRAQRSADPSISIVIPVRNEARNLEVVLPELPPFDQVVLVDGHSVDGTVEVAQRLRPDLTLVQQTRTGKGNALACGFEAAKGDIIVMFDADGSADPAEIPAFVSALKSGADFAKGTRFHRDGHSDDITALRKAGNTWLRRLANLIFRTKFSDLCYGYNAFWRDIVPLLHLPSIVTPDTGSRVQWGDGFEIETLLSCRAAVIGLSITEVPSVERPRIFGETNLRTFADGTRVLRTIFAEWRRSVSTRETAPKAPEAPPPDPPPDPLGDTTVAGLFKSLDDPAPEIPQQLAVPPDSRRSTISATSTEMDATPLKIRGSWWRRAGQPDATVGQPHPAPSGEPALRRPASP